MRETHRRTKIVATLGPATDGEGIVEELVRSGMDCARLNCSHSDAADLRRRARSVRDASVALGRPVALMFDLQGPKIRLGETSPREFAAGENISLTWGSVDGGDLHVPFDDFGGLCTERSDVVIGDGVPRFSVLDVGEDRIDAVCTKAGTASARKGVNVTHAQPMLPALTDKDLEDIATACELDADYIALSFVRTAEDVRALRSELDLHASTAGIIAKVEKVEAFESLTAIVPETDGVMVARGDYGIEAGVAHVARAQKETIRQAVTAGKVVITATQMFESMVSSPEPTRAEALDLHNAIVDGTSAVMLSGETSVGKYPIEAVRAMASIALVAEREDIFCAPAGIRNEAPDQAVMFAAVALGRDADAAALVVPTSSGNTVHACAKFRPRRPILALCHNPKVANQLALEWGVHPWYMSLTGSTDELFDEALKAAREVEGLEVGDYVVITAGPAVGRAGATNLIALKQLA